MSRPACLAVAALLAASPARAGLAEYVGRPDPSFEWKVESKDETPLGTVHTLRLVSQTWHDVRWTHRLRVHSARGAAPSSVMLLLNTGGDGKPADTLLALEVSRRVAAPVAFLYGVPNQPLFDGRREDALIAETFVRFLASKDETWPLLFPMVKSVVKSMDALQAFAKDHLGTAVDGFVVAGASKRGWTAWLTAASDPRVKAVVPMVIDTLNMPAQLDHQKACYGGYSDMIRDYTERRLVPPPETPEARRLWAMVDPYRYRDRLTQPKLIVNGANDPYWTVDSLNLYWDDLPGDKWVVIVPNAGHDLAQRTEGGGKDFSRLIDGVAAFARAQAAGRGLPKLAWGHDDEGGKLRVRVTSSAPVKAARLWAADAPTRDFRKSVWAESAAAVAGKAVVGTADRPAAGFRAVYAELDFEDDGKPFRLSTQVRVAGPK